MSARLWVQFPAPQGKATERHGECFKGGGDAVWLLRQGLHCISLQQIKGHRVLMLKLWVVVSRQNGFEKVVRVF